MIEIPRHERPKDVYCGSEGATAMQLLGQVYRDFGWRTGLFYLFYRFLRLPQMKVKLRHRNAKHPVLCRMGTSDIEVFRLIFSRREYSCLDRVKAPSLIVDCGANVGYASVYFLSRFPNVHVIAVEPDPENFALLEKNLSPYAGRWTAVRAAIWSSRARMTLSEKKCRADAVQVSEAALEEKSSIEGVTLDDLLSGRTERVGVLKVDIEGSEKDLFSKNYGSWLPRVDNIAIELHDDEARSVFGAALTSGDFSVTQHGELTVCRRSSDGDP